MRRTKIITHYGKAHRDEFLACCIVFFTEYRYGRTCVLERRVATQTDLASPNVWVVDTGNVYDPTHLNFDHHQIHGDMCSLDMVLKHTLGDDVYQSFRAVSPWLKNTTTQDNSGAKVAADRLNIDLSTYMSTRSPIEKFVLSRFSETMIIHCESYLSALMRDIGRMIVTDAEHVSDELPDMINSLPSPSDHNGLRIWDIRSMVSDDSTALAVINQAAHQRGVEIMISSTGRSGGGFGLYRQAWAKSKIDLSLLKDQPQVKFTHKNGYYAVIDSSLDDNAIIQLLDSARTSDQ